MIKTENRVQIVKGKNTILSYFQKSCYGIEEEAFPVTEQPEYGQSGMSVQTSSGVPSFYSPSQPEQDESCGVELDCDPAEQDGDKQQ
jgi:hypothetical protein